MPNINKLNVYECPCCGALGKVESISPNTLSSSFTYYKCSECSQDVQVNPYNIIKIKPQFLHSSIDTWVKITPEEVEIDLDFLTLTKITPENSSITTYLPYSEAIYDMGDNYSIEDILYVHNLIEFENLRNTYDLYEIKYHDIHLGYIGGEVYLKELTSTWLSWTIIIPEMRSRKIGAKALELFCNILKENDVNKLYVDSDYREATIRFYERLGFEKLGTCKHFRTQINKKYTKQFLLYDDDVVLCKDL